MRLRARLLVLSVSTVALIVTLLFALYLDSFANYWLDSALERSSTAGKLIQTEIFLRITDNPEAATATSLPQTKRIWNKIIADDKDLADMLVAQSAVSSGVIVEINVIGEDGKVVLSSIPSRTDQDAPVRPTLISLRNSDFFDRVSEIANSRTDYESRTPLGIADQVKPVFEIQVLVSPILLRDRIKPSVITTAWVLLFALLAAVIMAGVSSHLALLPVRRIGKAIDTLATGRPLGLPDPRQSGEDREIAAVEYKLSLLGEQMQGAKRDADQMRSAIGKLVRSVAHEIKNPLNAISLRLETLRMRVVDEVPDAEPEIDILSSEVQRLDGVVRTFLDLNRPMELNIGEFDPVELAAHVMEMMRPAAKQANVLLELVQPHLPLVVSADRGLIEQGLVNIVNNAIQALGSVTGRDGTGGMVRTSVAMVNGNCEIAVTDNGPGMPESVRDKIFEPYFTTKESGSGIGLAVTKRAMDLHRGRITVETAPGKGTRMILSFPMVHA